MIRLAIFLLQFLLTATCFAQDGYSVVYKYDERLSTITINGGRRTLPGLSDRLVFNDSLSLWYRIPQGNDPRRKNKNFGNKLIHHAILYNFNTNLYYHEVAWPKGKEFLIRDSVRNQNWLFLNDIKEILGYRCRSVLHVNEKNDSTLIWFTDSIPKPAGPLDYFGFPGLVLEVFDQVRGWHILAGKVERGAFGVTMPKGTMIIPREDYVSPKK